MADQKQPKRSVLITGCSNGGMGSALAIELHKAGLHVIATARDISKMSGLTAIPDIKLLQLDITSDISIKRCVSQVSALDILINNAGASYNMPISDISIPEAKKLYDLNVWGQIAITQAFLPLLLKSLQQPMIGNHTSIGAGLTIPFQGVYNACKSALSRFSENLRLELQPFGISVVELKTGGVKTNVLENFRAKGAPKLPQGTIYEGARAEVEKTMLGEWAEASMSMTPEQWARDVVADLLRKPPAPIIWRGELVWSAWFASVAPFGWFDGMTKKWTGLGRVANIIRKE